MAFSRVSARWNRRLGRAGIEEIDTKLVVGAVGVNGGSWLEVLSCGVNEGWVSELLVKLLKIHQIEPTSVRSSDWWFTAAIWIFKSASPPAVTSQ